MNQFNLNKFPTNTGYTGSNQNTNTPVPQEKAELQLEELVSSYIKENSNNNKSKTLSGNFIDNSDTELIKNHLEQYLHTDSLRLEIQIERLSEELETTEKHLKGLTLLPDSELKKNQEKALTIKKENILQALNFHKDEYKEISPIHRFAIWLKDKMKTTNKVGDTIKHFLYGKQANLLEELKQANCSMSLLVDQLEMVNKLPDAKENNLNIVDVFKQFEKIETNIENVKQDYYNNQPPDYIKEMKKRFQRMYYGYVLPEERYKHIPKVNPFS